MSEATYRPGTVVRYEPDPSRHQPRWCREGTAIANGDGRLVDTYWRGTSDSHVVTEAEKPSVEVLFHLDDVDEIDEWKHSSPTWETYAEQDRFVVTSQHGLQRRWFIRKGAQPDLDTQIENARQAVASAEYDLRSAERTLEHRQEMLDELLDQRPASPVALGDDTGEGECG